MEQRRQAVVVMKRSRRRHGAQWIATVLVAMAAVVLGILCVRTGLSAYDLSRAARVGQESPQRALRILERAQTLRPGLAEPWLQSAQWLLNENGDAKAAQRAARAAVARDPRSWQGWQLLALTAFEQSELTEAARDFQTAVRYNQGFDAHFRLANFAMLLGNRTQFWKQIRAALAVASEQQAVYAAETITRFAQGPHDPNLPLHAPDGRPIVATRLVTAYFQKGFWDAAAAVVNHLHCTVDQDKVCGPLAAAFATHALDNAWNSDSPAQQAHLARMAQAVWQRAIERGWTAGDSQQPGNLCTNGNFQDGFGASPFGWTEIGGVAMSASASGPPGVATALEIRFDGQEPERTDLLRQFVVVKPGQSYTVSYQFRSWDAPGGGGVILEALVPHSRLAIVQLPAQPAPAWGRNSAQFTVPAEVSLLALQFTYARPLGQVRLKAPVAISAVRLMPN